MLVIHEDILTKVMVAHFLLFCVNIFWLIFFAFWFGSEWREGLRVPDLGWSTWWRQPGPVTSSGYSDTTSRARRSWWQLDRR